MFLPEEIQLMNTRWRAAFEKEPAPRRCQSCDMLIYQSWYQSMMHKGRYSPHINHDTDGFCNDCANKKGVIQL
jgi:hypothetical protein